MTVLELTGTGGRGRDASVSMVASEPVSSPSGDGWQFAQRTRSGSGVVEIRPSLVPEPSVILMPTLAFTADGVELDAEGKPVFINAQTTPGNAGKLQVVVAGKNVSVFRGARTVIAGWETADPGGDAIATLVFPAITGLDRPGTGDLAWMYDEAPVNIYRVDAEGDIAGRPFKGVLGAYSDNLAPQMTGDQGRRFTVRCIGLFDALAQRITKPRPTGRLVDTGVLIASMVNHEIDYGFPAPRMTPHPTGVPTSERGTFGAPLTQTLANLAAQVYVPGVEYTLDVSPERKLFVARRDLDTVHFTLWYGMPGMSAALTYDPTEAVTNMWGMGQDGPRLWRNMMYPNAHVAPPPYPLPDGVFFNPGDSHIGFAPFAAKLTTRGFPMASGDTYLASDEDSVLAFQRFAGIQEDGVVGGQTWNMAFQTGLNANALDNAYAAPLAEVRSTDPYTYDSHGAITGRYPLYDKRIPRRERMTQYGNLSKALARKSAQGTVQRDRDPDWAGTITLVNIDPPERAAVTIRAGMNGMLMGHRGENRKIHVAHVAVDPGMSPSNPNRSVVLTVDEHGRPLQELYEVLQRRKDIADIAGRRRTTRRGASRIPEPVPYEYESVAGLLDPQSQTAGLWNVYQLPVGEVVDIVRIRLVCDGPTKMAAAFFDSPVTHRQLARLPGLRNPSVGSTDPWQKNQKALRDMGMLWATGGPDSMQGYWPNDPDGTLTGVLDDSGPAVSYIARYGAWGWLAVWTSVTRKISGEPSDRYRAIYVSGSV